MGGRRGEWEGGGDGGMKEGWKKEGWKKGMN